MINVFSDKPLLPAWATDKDVEEATNEILFDVRVIQTRIDQFVDEYADDLAEEAEAMLTHIAEGW